MTEEVPTFCTNGHEWNSETTRWESSGANGRMRKRCRQCRRDKKATAKAGAVEGGLPRLGAERSRRALPVQLTTAERLTMTDFATALGSVKAHCNGRADEFTNWEEENIPSPRTALNLCLPCPLLALCRDDARTRKPGWGIWGGEVWVYEKTFNGGTA